MKKCKIDECGNPATEAGNLCKYHKLKKQSELASTLKEVGKNIANIAPVVLSGIALLYTKTKKQ